MKIITKVSLSVIFAFASITSAMAQADSLNLYDLSMEELMNISIVSASNEKERLFDAPLSAYTITREEIVRAGAWSIPEALRLVPGVIVRETTNGNYDIHLRGFDNTAKYTGGTSQINTLTLVMINNRPVFNYNIGGTAWDALPVDIADVERIEVVCGPSAPLFGPNAVTGVINIITRSFKQTELLVSGQVQGSLPKGSFNSSLALGKQLNDQFSLGLTANYHKSERLDDQWYLYATGQTPAMYVNSSEVNKDLHTAMGLDPERALLRKGVNAYASFKPSENISFELSSGMQAAEAQKIFLTIGTPLSFTESQSFYTNLNSKINDLSIRMSYVNGEDDIDKTSQRVASAYSFRVVDVAADYELKLHQNFRLRPSIGYQSTQYDDIEQSKSYAFGGSLNGKYAMNILSSSLRADFTPLKGLRMIASGRLDRFDVNDDMYLSYQFASTYALSNQLMLRAVHARSYSGLFYSNTFANTVIPVSESMSYKINPDKDIAPSSNTMSEFGVRAQLMSNLQLDFSAFSQVLENVSLYTLKGYEQVGATTYIVNSPSNLPYTAHQQGLTLAATWVPVKQLQVKPFITLQKTRLRNFDYFNNPTGTGMPYVGQEVAHKNTPALYGGWFINYTPVAKLNINSSAYFFDEHQMSNQQDLQYQSRDGEIAGKMLMNARVSYQAYKKVSVFIGGKNLLNNSSREYYGTDRMGAQYYGGLSYNL